MQENENDEIAAYRPSAKKHREIENHEILAYLLGC